MPATLKISWKISLDEAAKVVKNGGKINYE